MAKCQLHNATIEPIQEDMRKVEAKCEILMTEVTIMKTQMSDIPKAIAILGTVLGIVQVMAACILFFFKH
jgi:hypothetical protein